MSEDVSPAGTRSAAEDVATDPADGVDGGASPGEISGDGDAAPAGEHGE